MPSSAFAMANIRAAAARSGSRRANRRNSAAGTSSRIGKPRPAIRSSRIRSDQNRITAPRVVPTHVRVSGIAGRYEAVLEEILEERAVSGRGRQVPRGVKRKMSSYPLRPRAPLPTTRVDFIAAIQLTK